MCQQVKLITFMWPKWRRNWQTTSVFLPGESHGQRSLVGYSPWGRKELDTAEQLTHMWPERSDVSFKFQQDCWDIESMTKKPMRAGSLSHTVPQYHRKTPSLIEKPPVSQRDSRPLEWPGHDQDSTEEQLFQETRSQRTGSSPWWEHRLPSPSLMCSHLRSHGIPLPRPTTFPRWG